MVVDVFCRFSWFTIQLSTPSTDFYLFLSALVLPIHLGKTSVQRARHVRILSRNSLLALTP